jgi:hypothetical protein
MYSTSTPSSRSVRVQRRWFKSRCLAGGVRMMSQSIVTSSATSHWCAPL